MPRPLDLLISSVAAVFLAPVALVIAVLVRLRLGRPTLFRQERIGLDGDQFTMLKFRTMTDERDSEGRLLPNEHRMTPFGQRLRSTSLDELPELLNVFRGDMALVGPRPLPTRYGGRYTAEENRRHEVRPGITGWAQVNGRNAISWEDRLAMDVWYVDNRSFALDVRIMLRTIAAVARRDGIDAGNNVTMTEFRPHRDRP